MLLLREQDVRQLVTMPLALEVVEAALQAQAEGKATNQPRRRLAGPQGVLLHYMAAVVTDKDYLGMKIYTSGPKGTRFLVPLYRASTGEPLALIEADYLGQMRTGAASGIASRYMARGDAAHVGIIGTGSQARTQLEAICLVRKIVSIRAYGRDPARRATFAAEMSSKLGIPVDPMPSAEAVVEGADIVITATTAKEPVLRGAWFERGVHINAIGANVARRRELDKEAVTKAHLLVTDSKEQAREEAGDLIQVFEGQEVKWESVRELCEIVSGKCPGRKTDSEITVFKSNGIALWDVALAGRVYELAVGGRLGAEIPIFST